MRQQGRCYIKYERKQGCFHMTVRWKKLAVRWKKSWRCYEKSWRKIWISPKNVVSLHLRSLNWWPPLVTDDRWHIGFENFIAYRERVRGILCSRGTRNTLEISSVICHLSFVYIMIERIRLSFKKYSNTDNTVVFLKSIAYRAYTRYAI